MSEKYQVVMATLNTFMTPLLLACIEYVILMMSYVYLFKNHMTDWWTVRKEIRDKNGNSDFF